MINNFWNRYFQFKKSKFLILIFFSLTILFFQNCAKGGFAPSDNLLASTSNSGLLAPLAPVVPSAPAVPLESIEIFTAQGYVGRTMISCDQGQTWVADRSDDDTYNCGDGGPCDHGSLNAMGITFGNGYFVGTWGHGGPGYVSRSADGVTWEKVLDQTAYDNVGFANNKFLLFLDNVVTSVDNGKTWSAPTFAFQGSNIRASGTTNIPGAYFIGEGDLGTMAMSSDGITWTKPVSLPADCGGGNIGFSSGNGIILKNFDWGKPGYGLSSAGGLVCRSADGGKNWTTVVVPNTWFLQKVIFDGSNFVSYATDKTDSSMKKMVSADGISWTPLTVSLESNGKITPAIYFLFGKVDFGGGAYVATSKSYADQKFYRSTDGVLWHELDPSKFKHSHPIKGFSYGVVKKSLLCP